MENSQNKNQPNSKWNNFLRSPLAMFAGIFSLLETVVIAFISNSTDFKPVDGVMLILLTVNMFVLIVLARPQALYPPQEWKEPAAAPEARIALWALIFFIFFIGATWGLDRGGDELEDIIKAINCK
jgi:hypothetical protein